MPRSNTDIAVVGIDIGKNSFHDASRERQSPNTNALIHFAAIRS